MVLLRQVDGQWKEIDRKDKQEGDLYLDGFLKKKLDYAKMQQARDNDVGGLVVGNEGSGKSTLASNIMIYASDGKFNPIKHIIKDMDHALDVLESVEDGGAIMFDEGYLLFSSTDVLTKKQKHLVKIFSIIRQKRLFFLVVAPSFFRLSTYFALDRTRFLIRVYEKNNERGYFKYWGYKKKYKLYNKGKRFHSYNQERPSFSGRFTKCSLLDAEYAKIKRETLAEAFKEAKESKIKKPTPKEIESKFIDKIIMNNPNKSQREIAEILNLDHTTIFYRLKRLKEDGLVSI